MRKTKGFLIVSGALCLASAWTLFHVSENGTLPFFHQLNKAKEGQIRIACVGDSITYGYGVKGWPKNSYPAVLGTLLGDGYCVNNYGCSGRTAQPDGDFPYIAERIYQKSLTFRPDLVLLMLGTNDSKPYNWKGRGHFMAAIRGLVRTYRELPSHPAVWLLTLPPAFGSPVKFDVDPHVITAEICPALKALAEEENLPLIDLHTAFSGHLELFHDGVHPNVTGARLIAETVFQHLREYGRNEK